ncbi:MAG: AcrB/AcrD/AcrF family protein [Calditrichaeota bacterium]|nr:MAG: AcrB/AcrD/AcrF family protein [Calditrichota bacterium]
MNITEIAIKNNRVTYILLLIVLVIGLASYGDLPRDSMPPFTIRVVSIVTNFPGASPERIESLVTDKIEKVAQEIPQIKNITSTSRTGVSIVKVALKEDVPKDELQPIWDRLRRKVDGITGFPSGVTKPNVKDEGIGDVFGIFLAFKSDGFSYSEIKDYAEDLRNKIILLDDAAKVELGGVIDETIFVDFDEAELAKHGLSSSKLKGIINSHNIINSAGQVNLGKERIILEPSGNFETVNDIENILVPVGNSGETVALSNISNVYRDYISPRKSIAKLNGHDALFLYISLKDEANIIKLGQEVDELLVQYNKSLPVGLEAIRTSSQDYYVESSVNNFVSNVLQSLLIVLVVMFVFLGFRTGIVVAILIPTTIITTFLLMSYFVIGLNKVSLAALIMALGMLVDNAIVIAESYMVRLERGDTKTDAAIATGKELMVPLLISTLTTSAAFLSFYLSESVMGEMMGQLFSVITLALLSSWVVALAIVPLFAMVLIKVKKEKKQSVFDKWNIYYNKLIIASLKKPFLVILTVVILFIVSLFGFGYLPVIFMPDSDRSLVTMDINLPLGSRIETTEQNVTLVEQFIQDSLQVNKHRPRGIINWSSFIGVGPNAYDLGYMPEEQNSGYAHLLINTTSNKDNNLVMDKLDRFCFNNLHDANVVVKKLGTSGGSTIPIEIRLSGDDPEKLFTISGQIKKRLNSMRGTKNVDDNWGPKIKKFYVKIHQSKLSRSGLTNNDIAISLNTVLSGFRVGEYRENENTFPIEMRAKGSSQISYDNIESLTIFSQNSGKSMPLGQVASIIPEWQFAKILRRDLQRTITVESQIESDVTAVAIINEISPWLQEQSKNWPVGYTYEFGGDSESRSEAVGAVIAKLPISFFIIVLLLIIQFNSVRKTTIILSTIPFGLIGLVGGLLLAQSYFSFTAFLGLISLAGIIINNAIVLIDRIELEQSHHGHTPYKAIIQAANERFRPILLTTFTTSFGMLPLWFGGGDMWRPMAIGIIFGLFFATVITLLFVPVMYKIFYRVQIIEN